MEIQGTEPVVETPIDNIAVDPIVETSPEVSLQDLYTEMTEMDIDALLASAGTTEEVPTSPVFTPKDGEADADFISEEEFDGFIQETENAIQEVQKIAEETAADRDRIKQEFEELSNTYETDIQNKNTELETLKADMQVVYSAWDKVQEHPELGPLVIDVVQGKTVSLPKIVKDKIANDMSSMPNIPDRNSVSIDPTAESLQDIFESLPSNRYT